MKSPLRTNKDKTRRTANILRLLRRFSWLDLTVGVILTLDGEGVDELEEMDDFLGILIPVLLQN